MFIGQNRNGSVESEGTEGEDDLFLENLNTHGLQCVVLFIVLF